MGIFLILRRFAVWQHRKQNDLPIDSYTFCEEMYKQTGAFVTPGDCFEQSHSMRIGYACDAEILKAGLCAVSEYIKMKLKVN